MIPSPAHTRCYVVPFTPQSLSIYREVIFLELEYLFTILFFVLRDRYYIQYFEAKQHDFLIHKTKSQVAITKQIGILIHELCVVPIMICHNIQPDARSRSCQEAMSISCRSCC
ncbi:hypothetical protein PRUPE_3G218600 [Prunus persica]|uniref:Uncharacterized protein n=1 Tax=Prunus persica TaxID=3760 RepID=A0A251Q3T5_PRUPE|nr:hypothetical protein PRUPE_3G218600 [Prunus persica]